MESPASMSEVPNPDSHATATLSVLENLCNIGRRHQDKELLIAAGEYFGMVERVRTEVRNDLETALRQIESLQLNDTFRHQDVSGVIAKMQLDDRNTRSTRDFSCCYRAADGKTVDWVLADITQNLRQYLEAPTPDEPRPHLKDLCLHMQFVSSVGMASLAQS